MPKENSNSDTRLYELTEFGLTPLQAKVYIALVKLGASCASEIARELNVSRTEIYPVLAGLQKLGLVEASLAKPIKFKPAPIENALSDLLDQMRSKVAELENKKKKIHSWLTSIEGKKEAEERFTFNLLLGVPAVHAKVINMVRDAEKEIDYAMCATCLLRILNSDVADELKKCVKRGVKVGIVSDINDDNIKDVEKFKDLLEFQHSDQQKTLHMMVVDEKETVVGVATEVAVPETGGYINLWTNSTHYTHAMKNFFNVLWRDSVDINSRIDFLRVGKPIERFEVIRNKKTWFETIIRMCRNAKKDLIFITNKPGFLIGFKIGLADATVNCANRGVEVRSILKIDKDMADLVDQVRKYLKIRHSDEITTLMVIMDNKEMIFSPAPEDPSEFSWSRVWTNNLNLIKTMHDFFDQLWQNSVDAEERINEIIHGKPIEVTEFVEGADKVQKYVYDIFTRAKSVWLVAIDNSAVKLTLEDAKKNIEFFIRQKQRGIKVRCLTSINYENSDSVKELCKLGEVRHADILPLRVVISDSECLITGSKLTTQVPEEAIYSNKRDVLRVVWGLTNSTWDNAVPAEERIKELESIYAKKR